MTRRRLASRSFLLLWQGRAVSDVGSQAFTIATLYWVMEATDSASLMGLLMTLSILPLVLLGPAGGTLADWFERRLILVVCDLVDGLFVLSLAGWMLASPDASPLLVGWLGLVVVVKAAAEAFFEPASAAAVPDLVPSDRLAAANSMVRLTGRVSRLVGQGLGGVLYAVLGAPLLLLIDGLSYLFSAGSEAFIRLPPPPERERGGLGAAFQRFGGDTVEGLRHVWGRRGLRAFVLAAVGVNTLLAPVLVLLPFYVDQYLGAGPAWYGWLLAAMSCGAIAGFGVASAGVLQRHWGAVLPLALVCFSGSFAVLGQVGDRFAALGLMAVAGVMVGIIDIAVFTRLQQSTPSELRGRTLAFYGTLAGIGMPVGMLLGGVLGDLSGKDVPLVFGLCGVAAVAVSLMAAASRDFREFLS